jgi:hypothetical protein
MLFESWYSDRADVFRIVSAKVGGVTKTRREKVLDAVPCRIYLSPANGPSMQDTAARSIKQLKMACAVGVDIRTGDELQITRGRSAESTRYFAGEPQQFYDPVGGALTGLEHQEIGLYEDNIIKG